MVRTKNALEFVWGEFFPSCTTPLTQTERADTVQRLLVPMKWIKLIIITIICSACHEMGYLFKFVQQSSDAAK